MVPPRRLRQQVEKIIDEGEGERRTVIVRLSSPGDGQDRQKLLGAASEALRMRRLIESAREILPPGVSRKSGEPLPQKTKKRLREAGESIAAQVAASGIPTVKQATVRGGVMKELQSLCSHDLIRKSVAGPSKTPKGAAGVRELWAARSMVLTMAKDDLRRVPEEIAAIGGIYQNRMLRVPRVVEVKSLPANVQDNKASAWGVQAVGSLAAWGAFGARGGGVKIGLLDTGVDASHPDLNGKVTDWAEFDSMGRVVPGSTPHDTDQHGTHTAGTLVGGKLSSLWIGVAPDAKLSVALVLDGQVGGTDAQVLAGIGWAIEQGVDVISMSLGGLTLGTEAPGSYTEAILTALQQGIPVVAAIGNEGEQTTGSPGNDLFAFSVGATDPNDRAAGFSGGRTHIITASDFIAPEHLPLTYSKPEVSAPGVAVKSSVPGGKWAAFNGTSMATPHVSGAIAVLLSATKIKNAVSGAERAFLLQDLLIGSVEELGEAGQDHRFGFGRIDVLRAIGFAKDRGF